MNKLLCNTIVAVTLYRHTLRTKRIRRSRWRSSEKQSSNTIILEHSCELIYLIREKILLSTFSFLFFFFHFTKGFLATKKLFEISIINSI